MTSAQRAAQTPEDAAIQLPEGFIPVGQALPGHDRPVLAIRKSGYICLTFEVMTARYMLAYRPNSPWRDISGDAVDSGEQILGWREMPDWFGPEVPSPFFR